MTRFNFLLTATLLLTTASPYAQTPAATRQQALAQAQTLMNGGEYRQAYATLRPWTNETDKDPKMNYAMGVAQAMSGQELDDALRRLRLAQVRGVARNECNLYIGRACQLLCEYEQAEQALEKFLLSNKDENLAAVASDFLAETRSSLQIASKIFATKTLAKANFAEADFLGAYHAAKEVGTVSRNSRFFQSDIDPDGIMYMTERGDAVYFALPNDEGKQRLQKIEKLIGGWGDMVTLQGLQGDGDDIMPVLMTDGVTLYFSSNRTGGMGGYDIWRSTYDNESRSFSEPVNMGVPFNSAYDDFLFVPDEYNGKAWFASNRETRQDDTLTVYEVVWDDSVIRNFAKSTEQIRQALAMEVDPASAAKLVAKDEKKAVGGGSVKIKDAFRLQVGDTLTYTQWEHFRSEDAKQTYRQARGAQSEKDSLTKVMAAQRTEFSALTSNIERNAKLQDLLKTERRIYALEDEVAAKTEAAVNKELQTIAELIAQGKYTSLSDIAIGKKTNDINWQSWLRPANFSMYTVSAFQDIPDREETYAAFEDKDKALLLHQDTLIAWGSIISMEAEALAAKAKQGETIRTIAEDGSPTYLSAEKATERSADYSSAAFSLVSKAVEAKRVIFEAQYDKAISQTEGYDTGELTELRDKAAHYLKIVKDVSPNDPMPKREKALLMMRRAMESYDEFAERLAAHADGSFPLPSADGQPSARQQQDKQTPSQDDTQDNGPAQPETQQQNAEQPKTLFRIQLGVFKGNPNLSRLPDPGDVTKLFLEDRGVTKYFYGSYTTQADAQADVPAVRSAGFAGAFVVAF